MIIGRILAILGLLLVGLLGLGMSVCGGGFTVMALLPPLRSRGLDPFFASLVLLIAFPSLMLGVHILTSVWGALKQVTTEDR
jgi:hypothetical protein